MRGTTTRRETTMCDICRWTLEEMCDSCRSKCEAMPVPRNFYEESAQIQDGIDIMRAHGHSEQLIADWMSL